MFEISLRTGSKSFDTLELAFNYLVRTVSATDMSVYVLDHARKRASVWNWLLERFVDIPYDQVNSWHSDSLATSLNEILDTLPSDEVYLNRVKPDENGIVRWVFRNDRDFQDAYSVDSRYLFDATSQLKAKLVELGLVKTSDNAITSNCGNTLKIGKLRYFIEQIESVSIGIS